MRFETREPLPGKRESWLPLRRAVAPVDRLAPRPLHGEDCHVRFSGWRLECFRPIPRSKPDTILVSKPAALRPQVNFWLEAAPLASVSSPKR